MHVLVTGGAGYIGSATTARLLTEGHRVTVLDDLRSGHAAAVPAEAALVTAAVTDRNALDAVLADDVDACIHFAASIEAGESMRRPEAYFANNTASALILLEALVEAEVGRVVLSSTAAVYGEPEATPIPEDAALAPTNAYGESKLLVERAMRWIGELRGLRTAALRYFNAAGASPERGERHDPETHLIPLVLQVATGERDHISVFGTDYPTPDGTCIRDYVHVDDLAAAHVLALDALTTTPSLTINLGNGRGYSVHEVIDAARRVTGHPIPAVTEPRRPGDPAVLVASSAHARTILGWEPQHPDLDEIVRSAWAWLQGRVG